MSNLQGNVTDAFQLYNEMKPLRVKIIFSIKFKVSV